MAEIIDQIQSKPRLARQIFQQGNGVVVGILMGVSFKLTPPLIARMRIEPIASWLQRKECGVERTGWTQHGTQLQQGRVNRIQREVTEDRISESELHWPINLREIEMVGCKWVYFLAQEYQPRAALPHQKQSYLG